MQVNELFRQSNTILLDGGMGTMLQAAGHEDTLDLGLIVDDKLQETRSLVSPEDIIREVKDEVTIILSHLDLILKELK